MLAILLPTVKICRRSVRYSLRYLVFVCVNADNFFLSFVRETHVVNLTSCISSSLLYISDQNCYQNLLLRYENSLPGDRVNFSSFINLNPH